MNRLWIIRIWIWKFWADYDNDGNTDCFVVSSGAAYSYLYRNEGNGIINKVTAGEIADSSYNTGWGCAWADYDNDGYADLFITAANNFRVVHHPNRLYHNSGNGEFTNKFSRTGLTHSHHLLLQPGQITIWTEM